MFCNAPEKRRNRAVATSDRMTKATSTSSSEKPRTGAGRKILICWRSPGRSLENRDTAGQPIHVDVELALARGERDAAAVRAPVGEKTDGAHLLAHEVALRRVELELDLSRQRMRPRVALHLERASFEIEHDAGFLSRCERVA